MGVSGVFVNVINASSRFGAPEDYDGFSRPYYQIFQSIKLDNASMRI